MKIYHGGKLHSNSCSINSCCALILSESKIIIWRAFPRERVARLINRCYITSRIVFPFFFLGFRFRKSTTRHNSFLCSRYTAGKRNETGEKRKRNFCKQFAPYLSVFDRFLACFYWAYIGKQRKRISQSRDSTERSWWRVSGNGKVFFRFLLLMLRCYFVFLSFDTIRYAVSKAPGISRGLDSRPLLCLVSNIVSLVINFTSVYKPATERKLSSIISCRYRNAWLATVQVSSPFVDSPFFVD